MSNNFIKGINLSFKYKDTSKFTNSFKNNYIFKDCSFEVNSGDCIGLLGLNGSGKSTLLKLMLGTIYPSSGSILRSNDISLISLDTPFINDLTGLENSDLILGLLGTNQTQRIELLEFIKEFTNLGDMFNRPIKQYSTGMRAKLNFSISAVSSCGIILIDEVFAVGDKKFIDKSKLLIDNLLKSNKTFVIATHSIDSLKEYVNKTFVLESGSVLSFDNPSDGINYYKNKVI